MPMVAGRRVLVRADLNVPLANGEVADDMRIRAALPTIELLRERGAAIVLASHLGRPGGKVDPALSMAPVAKRLGELLGIEVKLAPGVIEGDVDLRCGALGPGDVLLLENTRFEPGETENDQKLAETLATLADLYVNDAFGAAHRAHASTEGVAAPPARLRRAAAGARDERAERGRRVAGQAAGRRSSAAPRSPTRSASSTASSRSPTRS